MKKRILSSLIAVSMLAAICPYSSFAVDDDFTDSAVVSAVDETADEIVISKDGKTLEKCVTSGESFAIPDGIEIIGESAFNAPNMKTVEIPDSVRVITFWAFGGCSSLEEVYLPESVEEIQLSAFDNCWQLKKVTIKNPQCYIATESENWMVFGSEADIYGYSNSSAQFYTEKNKFHEFIPLDPENYGKPLEKPLITRDGKTLIKYPSECTDEEYTVPDGVGTIFDFAFENAHNLRKITMPDSVTLIKTHAFSKCSLLSDIVFSKNTQVIDYVAFEECDNLVSVFLPKSLSIVGYQIFFRCQNLEKVYVEDGIKNYSPKLFYECPNVTIYGKKDSVAYEIATKENLPFEEVAEKSGDCTIEQFEKELLDYIYIRNIDAKIIFDDDNRVYHIICSNEKDKNKITSFTYTYLYKSDNTFSWNYGCKYELDYNHKQLLELIPEYVPTITRGDKLEISEDGKTLINYPDSTEDTFVIPDGIEVIGENAFFGAANLKTIIFPESVKRIEDYAFEYCAFESVDLPESLEYIGHQAFSRNINLKSITIPKNVYALCESFEYCMNLEELYFEREHPVMYQSMSSHYDESEYDTFYFYFGYGIGAALSLTTVYVPDNSYAEYSSAVYDPGFAFIPISKKDNVPTYTPQKKELSGDANLDDALNMADAVLIMQSLANPNKYGADGLHETHITERGILNADMDADGLTNADALEIQKILLKIYD